MKILELREEDGRISDGLTMDKMTTHGKFSFLQMAWDRVDLPDPELPATPMILKSAHGGA